MSLNYIISATDSFSSVFDKAEKRIKSVGQSMTDVGKKMTLGVTVPIAGAALAVGKASVDFESAFTDVIKTVDATDAQIAELEAGIRSMAKELPATATEIAAVASAAGQLGIETGNILGFTRVMTDLGNTTNMTASEAATQLARLANVTGMAQTDFDRLGSTIVSLGNNLATTEAEITEMSLRLAGAGSTIGLTESEILGFAGALSSVGIEAEAGGSAFSKLMVNIASEVATGGDKLATFAETAGMSTEQFSAAFKDDAGGAIITFIEGLGNVQDAGGNVFGVLEDLGMTEVRLRDAMLRASGAGDLFRKSIELGNDAWSENSALANEANLRYGTAASQLSMLWNRITDVAITLGDVLVPALMSVIDAMEPVFKMIEDGAAKFAKLDSGTQLLILGAIGLVAAIGPLLLILGMLATAIAAISWPIILIVAGIAALVAAFLYAWNNVEGFRNFIIGAFESIKAFILPLLEDMAVFIKDVWDRITAFWKENGEQIMVFVDFMFTLIKEGIEFVMSVIGDIIELAWGIIKAVFSTALEVIMGIVELFIGAFTGDWKKAWEGIKRIFSGIWDGIAGVAKALTDKVSDIIVKTWDFIKERTATIWDAMIGVIRNPANAIIGIANSVLGAYENMLNGVGNAINSIPSFTIPDFVPIIGGKTFSLPRIPTVNVPKIPSLAIGTNNVMSDGIAEIHKGESIVPANVAKGGYSGGSIVINVSAADFTDPEHVRKMARIFGDQFAREIGGAY